MRLLAACQLLAIGIEDLEMQRLVLLLLIKKTPFVAILWFEPSASTALNVELIEWKAALAHTINFSKVSTVAGI